MIVMGAPRQDPDTSFAAYRQAIEIAEVSRQQAIAAALAGHCRVLEDIEAAYRHAVAAARWCYSQRMTEPAGMSRLASVMVETEAATEKHPGKTGLQHQSNGRPEPGQGTDVGGQHAHPSLIHRQGPKKSNGHAALRVVEEMGVRK